MSVIVQPCSNTVAFKHYKDTIIKTRNLDEIKQFLHEEEIEVLNELFTNKEMHIWGVEKNKRTQWERIAYSDIALFYRKKKLFSKGVVLYKTNNKQLAEYLWGVNDNGQTWEYIYFLTDMQDINISIEEYNEVMDYKPNYIVQGFLVYDDIKAYDLIESFNLNDEIHQPKIEKQDLEEGISRLEGIKKKLKEDKLNQEAISIQRKEQSYLREHLFKNQATMKCAICNKEYPSTLMVAGHIKKRSLCTHEEKLDFDNIAMPICKFGCDELFEKGFIFVDNGVVKSNLDSLELTKGLRCYVQELEGNHCSYFTPTSKKYFDYHKEKSIVK